MEFNLRGIDLNLLPVFEAAYEERSLSRAAARLAMTQPAMSHALSRLRMVFRDELFIRHSRGMTPTPAAEAIYERLRDALAAVREVVHEATDFDPALSSRRFFVAIPHPLGPTIALRLRAALMAAAPHIQIEFSTRSRPVDLERDLRDGRVDVAIDWLLPMDEKFNAAVLFEDRIVAMARADHPAFAKTLSLKALQAANFVTLRQRDLHVSHHRQAIQQWRSLHLNAVLEVSELLEVLMVVSQSDLFGIMVSSMAGIAETNFGVKTLSVSDWNPPPIPIQMVWHSRREDDAAHRFLREQIRTVTGALA